MVVVWWDGKIVNFCNSDFRFDALDTKIGAVGNDLASNVTEINTKLELLESQMNVSVSSDVQKLQQKLDELESEQIPALKKDRIEIISICKQTNWKQQKTILV